MIFPGGWQIWLSEVCYRLESDSMGVFSRRYGNAVVTKMIAIDIAAGVIGGKKYGPGPVMVSDTLCPAVHILGT